MGGWVGGCGCLEGSNWLIKHLRPYTLQNYCALE